MPRTRLTTAYAALAPVHARVVLAIFATSTLLLIAITFSPWRSGYADVPDRGAGDVQLYAAEVARIAAGERYYEAAGHELRARGYPTESVFNWRTPLPMWLIGRLPALWLGRALLAAIAVTAMLLAAGVMVDEAGPLAGIAMLALMSGAFLPCFVGELYVMPVVWAAALIALSASAQAAGWAKLGLAAGLAAPFFRELALLYCLVVLALAVVERRRAEAISLCVGIAAFAVFYLWHAQTVAALVTSGDYSHREGWVQMGGAPFLIALAQMNCYLLLLPQWVTALYLPLAVLGLAGWRSPAGTRIAAVTFVYLGAFAFAGQSFNQYWGVLVAPLLCFGVVRGPATLRDLLVVARPGVSQRSAAMGAN